MRSFEPRLSPGSGTLFEAPVATPAGDNSPQMAQSVHGTRRPTRALYGGRGPTEGSARKSARTASPGGRTDGADPEAAGHYGRGQARSRRRGKAPGGVHRGPRRGANPRRGPLNAAGAVEFVAAHG